MVFSRIHHTKERVRQITVEVDVRRTYCISAYTVQQLEKDRWNGDIEMQIHHFSQIHYRKKQTPSVDRSFSNSCSVQTRHQRCPPYFCFNCYLPFLLISSSKQYYSDIFTKGCNILDFLNYIVEEEHINNINNMQTERKLHKQIFMCLCS